MSTDVEVPQAPPTRESVAPWVRLSRYASLTILVWSIALQLLAGAVIPPVAVIGVIFGVLTFFLTGERRRLAAVVGLLTVVALLGNIEGTIDELAHPDSSPAFILTLLVTMAAVTAVVAALGALLRWSSEPIRAVVIAMGGLFVAGIVVSVVASASVDSSALVAGDVEVVAVSVEFEPTQLSVAAGETGFWVDNRDGIRHTFTIEGTGMEIDVPAFSAQRAVFDLDPGSYVVFCDVPGHENMRIDLTVGG